MSEPTRRKYVSLSEDEVCSQLYGVDNDIEVTQVDKTIMFPEPVDESLAQAYADHQWSRNQDLESWEAVIETPSVEPLYNYSKEITKFIKSNFYIEYPDNIILTKLQKEREVTNA
jgi:hypothetical protein